MTSSESQEQIALFLWAELCSVQYPELKKMFAIPNGGKRFKTTAKRMKAEGVKPGIPDICLPVARGNWHALYIEMKVGRNELTDQQWKWVDWLTTEGNLVMTCKHGWQPASEGIVAYLEGKL